MFSVFSKTALHAFDVDTPDWNDRPTIKLCKSLVMRKSFESGVLGQETPETSGTVEQAGDDGHQETHLLITGCRRWVENAHVLMRQQSRRWEGVDTFQTEQKPRYLAGRLLSCTFRTDHRGHSKGPTSWLASETSEICTPASFPPFAYEWDFLPMTKWLVVLDTFTSALHLWSNQLWWWQEEEGGVTIELPVIICLIQWIFAQRSKNLSPVLLLPDESAASTRSCTTQALEINSEWKRDQHWLLLLCVNPEDPPLLCCVIWNHHEALPALPLPCRHCSQL